MMPSTQEFWDSAVHGGPVSRAIEPFYRLLRLVQLGPDLLAITIRYRVFATGSSLPSMSLPILDIECLVSDLGLGTC